MKTRCTVAVAVMFLALPPRASATPGHAEEGARRHSLKIFVFGDSISDNGNFPTYHPEAFGAEYLPPYDPMRMSNGPIWVDDVGRVLGIPIVPEVDGGTNYAAVAATISPENYLTVWPDVSGFAQVERFLAKYGHADADAIYIVWLGVNDIDPPAAYTDWAFGTLVEMIDRLYAAGARIFLVPNLMDVGGLWIIPFFFGPEYAAALSEMTLLWNDHLHDLAESFPEARIRISDVYRLKQLIDAYPAAFGFTNTTEPCYRRFTDGAVCADPDSYWFWDGAHPTSHGHRLLASQFVLDMLIAGEIRPGNLKH